MTTDALIDSPSGLDRLDSGRAWVQVVAALTSMFVVFGVGYSFGAFFESMADEFGTGSGATALVFSITISLSFALAPISGAAADRFGPKPVVLVGAASLAAGLLLTTIVPSILLGYATYGIGVGVAIACGYVPMVATVGGWFEKRRTLALGVAVAGIGLGTLVGSPLSAALIEATSWRRTFVIYAIGGAVLLIGVAMLARPGPAAVPAARPQSIRKLMQRRDFAILYVASLLVSFGLFVPFVFLATYSEDAGSASVSAAALIGVIGGASIVGRLGLGSLADRLGVTRLFRLSFVTMGISHLIWLAVDQLGAGSFAGLLVYAIVLGIGYGGFIAISPAVVAARFGMEGIGGILGTLYTSAAVGSLLGPPLAGLLIDGFGYAAGIIGAAAVSIAGTVVLFRLD